MRGGRVTATPNEPEHDLCRGRRSTDKSGNMGAHVTWMTAGFVGQPREVVPRQYAGMETDRIEVQRTIDAEREAILAILRDSQRHVVIDRPRMLMSAEVQRAASD